MLLLFVVALCFTTVLGVNIRASQNDIKFLNCVRSRRECADECFWNLHPFLRDVALDVGSWFEHGNTFWESISESFYLLEPDDDDDTLASTTSSEDAPLIHRSEEDNLNIGYLFRSSDDEDIEQQTLVNLDAFQEDEQLTFFIKPDVNDIAHFYTNPMRFVYRFTGSKTLVQNSIDYWKLIERIFEIEGVCITQLLVHTPSSLKSDVVEFQVYARGSDERRDIYQRICEELSDSREWMSNIYLPFMFHENGCRMMVSSGFQDENVEDALCEYLEDSIDTLNNLAIIETWTANDQPLSNYWNMALPWNQGEMPLNFVQNELWQLRDESHLSDEDLEFLWCSYVSGLSCYFYCYRHNKRPFLQGFYDKEVFDEERNVAVKSIEQQSFEVIANEDSAFVYIQPKERTPLDPSLISYRVTVSVNPYLSPEERSRAIWKITSFVFLNLNMQLPIEGGKLRTPLLPEIDGLIFYFDTSDSEMGKEMYQRICTSLMPFSDILSSEFPPFQYHQTDCLASIATIQRHTSFGVQLCNFIEENELLGPVEMFNLWTGAGHPTSKAWDFESPSSDLVIPQYIKTSANVPFVTGISEASHHWTDAPYNPQVFIYH